MLFSIIVPIYNVEKYLKQCIESVINQTSSNFELILVNDGSPDNCPRICDEYSNMDSRIKVVHKKNGGLISARKAGAKEAKGDYVLCLDGDDWIKENYVEKFNEIAKRFNPDVICCGCILANENENIDKPLTLKEGFYDKKEIENAFSEILIENNKNKYFPPSIWGKAFKRELYLEQQLNVSEKITIGEDKACVVPCIYNANSMYIMPNPLYYYRYNDQSITKGHKVFRWEEPLLIREHLIKNIDYTKKDFLNQINRNATHGAFNVALSQFNRKESYFVVSKAIKTEMRKDNWVEIINNCDFKLLSKGNFARVALKYKIVPLIWLQHKLNK